MYNHTNTNFKFKSHLLLIIFVIHRIFLSMLVITNRSSDIVLKLNILRRNSRNKFVPVLRTSYDKVLNKNDVIRCYIDANNSEKETRPYIPSFFNFRDCHVVKEIHLIKLYRTRKFYIMMVDMPK